MQVTFNIEKITPSNEGKTAVLTLSTGIGFFGIENIKKNIFYIGGLVFEAVKHLKVGEKLTEEMDNFWQVKRPYYIAEKTTWVLLTYLHHKSTHPECPIVEFPAEYLAWKAAQDALRATPKAA